MGVQLVNVNAGSVDEYGFFCARNRKEEGYQKKRAWLVQRFEEGLQIKILKSETGNDLGFIEYVPGEYAWRPVEAKGYLFIHCIFITRREHRGLDFGSQLIQACLVDAERTGRNGVAVACSEGPWIAGKSLFLKNGFQIVDRLGRYELLVNKIRPADPPAFIPWEARQSQYRGWHLVVAHQCPWHAKACRDLAGTAKERGLELRITEITDAAAAQQSPSGFGVFALLHDGKLLADHYVSKTRFLNILKEEGIINQ